MFTSYQNYYYTTEGPAQTTYDGGSVAGPCGNTDDPVRGGRNVSSLYSSQNSPCTSVGTTWAGTRTITINTFFKDETVGGDIFYDTWTARKLAATNYSYAASYTFVSTISWNPEEGSFATVDTTVTDDIVKNGPIFVGSSCISYNGNSGTAAGVASTISAGYTAAQGTTQSNYYKTTQKTSYYTTVPTLSDGTCSTVSVTLTGGGTTQNISDNFTTESDILITETKLPDQYGLVNYYHVGRDDVLFTGVPAATNLNNYRFSDVYKLHPQTSYSYRETDSYGFAAIISPDFIYEVIGYFDILAIRPVNLSSWVDSDQSQTGSFWAGFGNSFNATNQPVYKTLTTSSAGDTWAESNLLQTTAIGNAIDDAGPRIIQTGCQPWTQDGTTSWSTPASTVQSSTESTLMATYSSTVSTSTAEGQPTTSTRSDKYASYTIGLESLAATSDTTTQNTIFLVGNSEDYSNSARAGDFKLTLGRNNEYSSNQTLLFKTGVFITSTENNGGGDTVGTTTLTQTNGTFVSTQQLDTSFTIAETFSGWTRELAQGVALAVDGEAIYNYSVTSLIPAFPINTNLGL